jgi:hypothetical protein
LRRTLEQLGCLETVAAHDCLVGGCDKRKRLIHP